jgi:hypothetical protein
LGSLFGVPWLGCCKPTALSAYASVSESQNDFGENCDFDLQILAATILIQGFGTS